MEIEKTLRVSAPPEQVWSLLLNPQVMAGAVPGMKSIEVISPTEYVAEMHQKISFINAKFKLKTKIVEQRAPQYMRVEGTGEDASVASSLKQSSEVFLTALQEGGTELRIKVVVDVLGRLGAFGLSVMKTKADRLWDEFAANLAARIEAGDIALQAPSVALPSVAAAQPSVAMQPPSKPLAAAPAPAAVPVPTMASPHAGVPRVTETAGVASRAAPPPSLGSTVVQAAQSQDSWWSRATAWCRSPASGGKVIRVEVRQLDKTIHVEWPIEAAAECRDWLKSLPRTP